MKRIKLVLLTALMCITGCSGNAGSTEPEKPKSIISIRGIYYSTEESINTFYGSSAEGMSDCIVVFDFNNDDINRTMPDTEYANCPEVQLTIGNNTYDSYQNLSYQYNLDRYSEMKNVLGYGNVLGGADTVRMYASFFVNPNDFKNDAEISLKIGDLNATTGTSDAKVMNHIVDCLQSEEELEFADLIFRCDEAFQNFYALVKTHKITVRIDSGSDFSLMSQCLRNTFNSELGVTLDRKATHGGSNSGYDEHAFSPNLKGFDLESVKKRYPEIATNIQGLIEAVNTCSDAIVVSGLSTDRMQAIADDFSRNYDEIMDFFSLDTFE